jgi:hypothetical protein
MAFYIPLLDNRAAEFISRDDAVRPLMLPKGILKKYKYFYITYIGY